MNKLTKKLVEQAGFVLWSDEDWRPTPEHLVDWGSDYEGELKKLINLVVMECVQFVGDPSSTTVKKMLDHFAIENES